MNPLTTTSLEYTLGNGGNNKAAKWPSAYAGFSHPENCIKYPDGKL